MYYRYEFTLKELDEDGNPKTIVARFTKEEIEKMKKDFPGIKWDD